MVAPGVFSSHDARVVRGRCLVVEGGGAVDADHCAQLAPARGIRRSTDRPSGIRCREVVPGVKIVDQTSFNRVPAELVHDILRGHREHGQIHVSADNRCDHAGFDTAVIDGVQIAPAGADPSANRNGVAAFLRCTAGHLLVPCPG